MIRRLLVLGGLVVTGWLLGGLAGTAHADVSSPCSAFSGEVRKPAAVKRVFPAAPPSGLPDRPRTAEGGPALPDPRVLGRIGDLLSERLPEVVDPPGGRERTEPGPSGRTVPADPGDESPRREHDRDTGADDTARIGFSGPGTTLGTGTLTDGGPRADEDRTSRGLTDEDHPPMGGDWLPPAAESASAGVGGPLGGYLGQAVQAERPAPVPFSRPGVDAPVVRTAVDEPFFAPD
ncbi:hypothetical protein [Thermomonospora echinospora]|nr:hypothetical protein [Thermomonospora echinospora]